MTAKTKLAAREAELERKLFELDHPAGASSARKCTDEARERFDLTQELTATREKIAAAVRRRKAPREIREAKPGKSYKTALGRNIDKYRMECGWSYDDLAYATDIDKKLVLGHVNLGKGAHPKTIKRYADIFSKQLGRAISAVDLRE
jgi:hypothetical protein